MKKFNSYLFTASNIVIFVLISLSLIGCGSTLSELVKQKNYDEVKINLDEGGDPNKYDKENGFPLIIAVNQKDIPMIELLLSNGASANIGFRDAIKIGDVNIIKLLIQYSADVNFDDPNSSGLRRTPLSEAIQLGDMTIIKLLLSHGADINKFYDYYSYGEAKIYGPYTATEKRIDVWGTVLLEALYLQKDDSFIKFLIQYGANINNDDKFRKTPLVFAVEQNRASLVKYLLEIGADPNLKYTYISERKTNSMMISLGRESTENKYANRSIIELAKSKGYNDIIEILKEYGASEEKSAVLSVADLELNTNTHEVKRGKELLQLTNLEYAILEFLLYNKNKVITGHSLAEHVGSLPGSVNVHIKYLSKKIDDNRKKKLIQTIDDWGYIIRDEDVQ